ncbi:MAG: anaerobic ribonucleoside-triphosphate reductase activating protein [Ruminococcaceae bacterium]|nr:anaerobic ribonucleoside-triphosphate reductase activating protein [Oscillospiraceae bacterium]
MYYGELKKRDIANGLGVRVALFVSGCTNHCEECFNRDTWDFHYGKPYTQETENEIIEALRPDFVRGLSLLGGEPMEPKNQQPLLNLVKRVKKELPQKDIWCYTGFTYDELLDRKAYPNTEIVEELISYLDVLVDGRFEKDKRNLMLKFRGSENQRLIDVKQTIKEQKVILLDL